MTELEINKTLHEAQWKCWHEGVHTSKDEEGYVWIVCSKCAIKDIIELLNPSYTSNWSAYGHLLEWAMKQEWWEAFVYVKLPYHAAIMTLRNDLFDPLTGSTAIAKFIKNLHK